MDKQSLNVTPVASYLEKVALPSVMKLRTYSQNELALQKSSPKVHSIAPEPNRRYSTSYSANH